MPALSLSTLLGKALGEKVAVKDGAGRRRRITEAEAVVTQLVNKAAGADLRAIRILLALEQGRRAGRTTVDGDAPEVGRSPEPDPPSRPLDVRGMTTEELCIVHEAMLIIDRRQEPPPHPVPPRDPGEDSE